MHVLKNISLYIDMENTERNGAFAVVHFIDTEEVEVVPSGWILSKNKACWPPFKSAVATTKAIKESLEPSDIWPKHSIRVLCACGKCI